MERFDPEATLAAIDDHDVTTTFMVPGMVTRLAQAGGTDRLRRLLSVLKVRDSEFDHTVREYAISDGGVRVQVDWPAEGGTPAWPPS